MTAFTGPAEPADFTPFGDLLSLWRDSVSRAPDSVLLRYFDGALTVAEVDAGSAALAVALADRGVRRGDRVAVYLQNVPQFVLVLLAVWQLGAIVVPVNPMNKRRELTGLLTDSGAEVLVCLESLYRTVAADALPDTPVRHVLSTSELDFQHRDDPRVFAGLTRDRPDGTEDLTELLATYAGRRPPELRLGPADVAVLTYTSGTTGPPKGALNTHGGIAFNAETYRRWMRLSSADVVFGVAPLFHITGLVGHVALALRNPSPLVLAGRFSAPVAAEAVAEHRATVTTGAITVFTALLNDPAVTREQLATLRVVYSGGAPIPPAVVRDFRAEFGCAIHNIYGLTETNSPTHAVPLGADAPVDPRTGALSVGKPVYRTRVRVLDEQGAPLPAGEIGEIAVAGPQVVPGYWQRPAETAAALPGGELRTGDVGYVDTEGWFYLVDRKKDQINASGFKVWPREVEDVLYEHPAVREAAVVGVPDPYRGETVAAFVSLRPGATATEAELIAFTRDRLAAYKYPRSVRVLAELPKTATGKILRRSLRG